MRYRGSLLVALGLLAVPARAFVYSDDFEDGVLNPSLWTLRREGLPALNEFNGRLEITIPANSFGDRFGAWVESVPKLVGDFDMTVEFDHGLWPLNNGVRTGMTVRLGSQFYSIERTCLSAAIGEEVVLSDINGTITSVYRTATAGKFRLERVSNVVTGYYWEDSAWNSLPSWTAPDGDMDFLLGGWSHDVYFGDQLTFATFDNFFVTDSAVPEPNTGIFAAGLLSLVVLRRRRRSLRR